MNYENITNSNIEFQNNSILENSKEQISFEEIGEETKENESTSSGNEVFQTYENSSNGEILQVITNIDEKLEYNNAVNFLSLSLLAFALFVIVIINTFRSYQ